MWDTDLRDVERAVPPESHREQVLLCVVRTMFGVLCTPVCKVSGLGGASTCCERARKSTPETSVSVQAVHNTTRPARGKFRLMLGIVLDSCLLHIPANYSDTDDLRWLERVITPEISCVRNSS